MFGGGAGSGRGFVVSGTKLGQKQLASEADQVNKLVTAIQLVMKTA